MRAHPKRVCKFCGCTDRSPCLIPMFYAATPQVDVLLEMFGHEYPALARPGRVAEFTTPCSWSALDLCSAPACIDKAYQQINEQIDRLLAEAA